jgi:hypothetical protein
MGQHRFPGLALLRHLRDKGQASVCVATAEGKGGGLAGSR